MRIFVILDHTKGPQWSDPWNLESRLRVVKYFRALQIVNYDYPRALEELNRTNARTA